MKLLKNSTKLSTKTWKRLPMIDIVLLNDRILDTNSL
jgi:hypothetical protein